MKNLFAIIAGCLFLSMNVNAASTTRCVSIETVSGEHCNSDDSLQVKVTNDCSQPVYVKMCIEDKIRGWTCGSDTMRSGETNTGFFACHATTKYEWDSCTGGYSECGFNK